ncbi:MAG: hypothetical protein JXN64_03100 [Spirochaetes bacterium]|nr:hypothetical protein [Spirochaetota bacterium]
MNKIKIFLLPAIACILLLISENAYSADRADNKPLSHIPYKPIEISSLSRYIEDRIAFQHIQLSGFSRDEDNSLASLLIIKNSEVYLFRDGYDDEKKVSLENYMQVIKNELPKDLWINKIDSRPDFIKIATRRTEKLLNSNKDYTEKNSGDVYRSIRNSFINYHVRVFKELMMNRSESEFNLQRKPIFPPPFKEMDAPIQFSSVIKARAQNKVLYYAEDKDGDEVTETFYVTMSDGFNWGHKSGPNIIFIYNNKEEDIKKFIGKLCHEAYFGTSEEEESLLKYFPKEADILNAFKLEKVTMQTSQPARQRAPASNQK